MDIVSASRGQSEREEGTDAQRPAAAVIGGDARVPAYIVTTRRGRRLRIEDYAAGARTKGGGDTDRPSIGIFDLSHPDTFGGQGQFVAAYHHDVLSTDSGLMLEAGACGWQLDRDTMQRIWVWIASGHEHRLSSEADARCPQCGRTGEWEPPLYARPHRRADLPGRDCTFVRLHERHFLPEDIVEGDIVSDDSRQEILDCSDPDEESAVQAAIEHIRTAGLTFEGSTSWASDPDGSCIVDHYTGERSEHSAHLYGFTEAEQEQIIAGCTGTSVGQDVPHAGESRD